MDKPRDADFAAMIKEQCNNGDPEADHYRADAIITDLLIDLGYDEAVREWLGVAKWYA